MTELVYFPCLEKWLTLLRLEGNHWVEDLVMVYENVVNQFVKCDFLCWTKPMDLSCKIKVKIVEEALYTKRCCFFKNYFLTIF